MAQQIVTLTVNPSLDMNTEVDNVVANHKLRCAQPQWQAGGGGINVSRVIKRLGDSPLTIYPSGGPQGEMLHDLLESEELTQTVIPIEAQTRESVAVREKSSNQQYRFSVPGPALSESEWQTCLAILRKLHPLPEYVVLSGGLPPEVPENFYGMVAEWAQQMDIRIILDTHGAPLRQAVNVGVFLLKPNLRELRQLAGKELADEEEQIKAVQNIIHEGGAQYVVLSLGAAGALFVGKTTVERLRAPTVKICSKVGAGDSMVAGIVWALTQNYSPLEAARFGVAAGAAAVQTPGTELCRREDAVRLYKQIVEH